MEMTEKQNELLQAVYTLWNLGREEECNAICDGIYWRIDRAYNSDDNLKIHSRILAGEFGIPFDPDAPAQLPDGWYWEVYQPSQKVGTQIWHHLIPPFTGGPIAWVSIHAGATQLETARMHHNLVDDQLVLTLVSAKLKELKGGQNEQ